MEAIASVVADNERLRDALRRIHRCYDDYYDYGEQFPNLYNAVVEAIGDD